MRDVRYLPNYQSDKGIALQKNFPSGYRSGVPKFGDNLKRIRESRGFKAIHLAEAVGVQPPTLSQWENEPGLPATPTLLKLAKALKCSVDELLAGVDPAYDAVVSDLIRHAGATNSTPSERGADVPASDGVIVEDRRVEGGSIERELAETRKVANRLVKLLEQSGFSEKTRPTPKPATRVRRGDRKTG